MAKTDSHKAKKARVHHREQPQEDGHFHETVGADLRAARKDRSLTVDEIADKLRLKAENIRAIEESDFDALPGKAYAIGFVRAYAQHMGTGKAAEAEEYVRRFKAEMTDAEDLKFNSITRKDPAKRLPFGLIATGAATLVLAVMVWRMADRAVGAGDDVIDAFQPGLPEVVTLAQPDPEPGDPGGSENGRMGTQGATDGDDAVMDESADVMSDIPDGTLWGSENHDARIRVKALTDVWLRIEVEGRVMFERILKTGDSYSPPVSIDTNIATRNASELEIYVDGRYIRRLGQKGDGFAGARLDPDALLEGP